MSGGERRIIEIYAILMSPSKFCLLDEPFSQVMPLHVKRLKEIIQREKVNKGLIITDHLLMHLFDTCDALYCIKNGKRHTVQEPSDLCNFGYPSMHDK